MDTQTPNEGGRRVLVTGASGYIGNLVVHRLAQAAEGIEVVIAADIRLPDKKALGATYVECDVRESSVEALCRKYRIDTLVHLVAVVARGHSRAFAYDVDVNGTRNVLNACLAAGVGKIVVTSSGAAYGYHADNPAALTEDDPLRGNESFPYAHHKRLVEEMLASYRAEHPRLKQLVFRPGTVLGRSVSNQITNLFEQRVVVGLRGMATPFVFIWDEDVADCILEGVRSEATGVYNMAGDGVMTLREVARRLGKPYVEVPKSLLERGVSVLKRLGATEYGPEQVDFLAYRPVLSNHRLKTELGYKPRRTTREAFEVYCDGRGV